VRPTRTPRPVRTPAPGGPETPVLSDADLRVLLATCAGTDFTARRDTAIIMLFLDGGLRLAAPAPAIPLGVKAARSLDRYLRERRRHPYADTLRLWLGSRGRPTLDADGVKAMLKRRGADAYRRWSLGDRI